MLLNVELAAEHLCEVAPNLKSLQRRPNMLVGLPPGFMEL